MEDILVAILLLGIFINWFIKIFTHFSLLKELGKIDRENNLITAMLEINQWYSLWSIYFPISVIQKEETDSAKSLKLKKRINICSAIFLFYIGLIIIGILILGKKS